MDNIHQKAILRFWEHFGFKTGTVIRYLILRIRMQSCRSLEREFLRGSVVLLYQFSDNASTWKLSETSNKSFIHSFVDCTIWRNEALWVEPVAIRHFRINIKISDSYWQEKISWSFQKINPIEKTRSEHRKKCVNPRYAFTWIFDTLWVELVATRPLWAKLKI